MPSILVFPHFNENPYLNVLYLAPRSQGYEIIPRQRFVETLESLAELGDGDVFHIHWTSHVCQSAATEEEAAERLADFRAEVNAATSRGVHVMWTVHNELPHELHYRELELELCEFIAEAAGTIIQLNERTADFVSGSYVLPPEKIVTLRHSSYHGLYPNHTTRREARERLGIPEDSPTIAFIGQIRPYKGLSTLFTAMDILGERHPNATLVLAGKTNPNLLEEIERTLPRTVRVVYQNGFVPDSELQYLFGAADLAVFPYSRILNSGSVFLSATLGRPCVVPDEATMRSEYGDESWVKRYPVGTENDAASLAATIEAALPTVEEDSRHADTYAREYTPFDMSLRYLTILRGLTSTAAGAAETPSDAGSATTA